MISGRHIKDNKNGKQVSFNLSETGQTSKVFLLPFGNDCVACSYRFSVPLVPWPNLGKMSIGRRKQKGRIKTCVWSVHLISILIKTIFGPACSNASFKLHISSCPILQFISLQGVILIVLFCGMPILVSAIQGSRAADHGEFCKATRIAPWQMTITIHIFFIGRSVCIGPFILQIRYKYTLIKKHARVSLHK